MPMVVRYGAVEGRAPVFEVTLPCVARTCWDDKAVGALRNIASDNHNALRGGAFGEVGCPLAPELDLRK